MPNGPNRGTQSTVRWTFPIGLAIGLALAVVALACNRATPFDLDARPTTTARTIVSTAARVPPFSLTSSAFTSGGDLPARFSCDGAGVSPPISWEGAPSRAASFVLIVEDPDAPGGTFTHWVFYNIPGTARSLPEGIAPTDQSAFGGVQGMNGARRTGYQPACPPPGAAHRYQFTLYALDSLLPWSDGATADDIRRGMAGHEIARAELTGAYQRGQR
jgi:Raf kinase inhibitor-like YbhB/YbcL family protein